MALLLRSRRQPLTHRSHVTLRGLVVALGAFLLSATALAAPPSADHSHAPAKHGATKPHDHDHGHDHDHPAAVHATGAPTGDEAGEHAHGAEGHGGHDDHGPGEINWFQGFLGESDEYEPSVLWRDKGTPVPFGATLLNTALLFFILFKLGKQPLVDGLKKRKSSIMQGMQDAAKMKEEAKGQLAHYEERLARIDQDIERVRKEMRESAEAERQRVLSEAKERRERMERDAKLLIEQELKAAHEHLLRETASSAVKSAEELIKAALTRADHDRIAEQYLETLAQGVTNAPGARS